MTQSSPPPAKTAFTLIELLVVIAAVAILAAIAVPAFTKVFESAKATKDLSNLRQIAVATQLYMNDNGGVLFSTRLEEFAAVKCAVLAGKCCFVL